ncbi:DUF58 domain-containing protein [Pontixanthobacter aestiaquae]|uniref:DUF58 domain-containing protein n=1 Tax=Pontixanthobacter aestiaquae TaxID=1509367 RepID=A0A844Z4V9_9SPHN|nr:DUF58 domain-containing protein [Pontixanthobacter aestiaquae]MDN3646478.1 DUF58 domain-containing protein [Pontixanthobacter aestiaquae]MXO82534.1 DUF58 domain-containing protein [Pontixanthobacter aestiaquae]
MKLSILPTARAAWLTALAAPVAIVIATTAPDAWLIVPAAAVALLLLVLLDGAVAGRLVDWRVHAPADSEVGEPLSIFITADMAGRASGSKPEAALQVDPRLCDDGRAEAVLDFDAETDSWQGVAELVPSRRGTAPISQIWLRWTGPLGLGARQVTHELKEEVRIWPDLSPIRSPELQNYLRDAQFGLIARRIRGEGTQFEALSEYEAGMDRRRIDWKASARHTKLYARENESERNNQIIFAFDCGQAMCEPVEGLPRIDRAVTAALTASYVALKGGDRVSLFGFAQRPEVMTPFVGDTRAFYQLQSAAAGLDYHAEEPNFTLALASLTARLQRRSLIVLFTDFTDPTGAEMMIESVGRLVEKHLVLFVTIEDAELQALTQADPNTLDDLAAAVTADTLSRQRAVVLQRLRQMGVDIIEAPWDQIGYRLIDSYLDIKRSGAIG